MTPKEKARELVDNMWLHSSAQDGAWMDKDLAKRCALIAVDELQKNAHNNYMDNYWQEVKQEINAL